MNPMANQSNDSKRVGNELTKSVAKTKSNTSSPAKAKPRIHKSVTRSSSIQQKHPTPAFTDKSRNEYQKLETKLAKDLLCQIADLFGSESFADLSLIRGKYRKRVHSCLVICRIPQLFTRLLNLNLNKNAFNPQTNEYCVRIPPEIKESELKELIEKIYSNYSMDQLDKDELHLMSKIEILNKTFNTSTEEELIQNKSNQMNSSVNSVSDNCAEDDQMYDNYEEDNMKQEEGSGAPKTQMVRSGTFELLTSIQCSENNTNDLNESDNKYKTNDEIDLLDSIENNMENIDLNKSNDNKNTEKLASSDSPANKSVNSMFSLFIDINEPTDETHKGSQRPHTTRDGEHRKGFDFIPLNEKLNINKKLPANQRSLDASKHPRNARNSADAVLMRSMDSALPYNKTLDDIPLLPMSPIVRKPYPMVAAPVGPSLKRQGLAAQKVIDLESSYLSSSDSFSDAYNECLNISVQSSSKNSYESDSVEVGEDTQHKNDLIDDFEDEFDDSDEDKAANDLDLNDSETFRNMKSCSKLGEDLLRMFVKQINADVVIRVHDREIKAHRCILTSRCRYFDAMLKGNWIESDSNRVDLQGFTYNSVYFALCHIYSGCLTLPDKLDLSELALLSDVLAMDSLKEIVVHELMVNRCHFFHAPCDSNCTVNIIKCLKLCSRAGLNDMYHKCLNWTAKHFNRVWPNRAFAVLTPQLMDACLQTKCKQLAADNVLKTTLETERMITSTPRVKWAEPVFTQLAKLVEECCNVIASNYDRVITSKDFLALGRGNTWDISTLEQTLLAAMTKLSPDISCRSLIELNKILLLQEKDQNYDGFSYGPFNDLFERLVTKMQRYCERYMVQNANHVVRCQSWSLLGPDAQQKIKDGAIIVFEFEKPIAPPPKLSSRVAGSSNVRKFTEPSDRLIIKVDTKSDEMSSSSSKGAVPKNFMVKNRPKITPLTNNGVKSQHRVTADKVANDQHIYDSVPYEDIPIKAVNHKPKEFTRKVEKVSNRALSLHLSSQSSKQKEKIAKVSPFSVKTPESNSDDILSVKDLVAEIDAETNLVTHCLQEAELLEQELTRKFSQKPPHNQSTTSAPVAAEKTTAKSSVNPTYGIVSQPQPRPQRPTKHSTSNGSARRTTATSSSSKSQTTSQPILKTRPLAKVTKQTRK